jgi:hypothetical protein
MPTIAEKLREEGMQQGELQGRRIALLRQMNRKFSLSAAEENMILSAQDLAILDQALETVLFAQDKSEVMDLLR